VILAAGEGTRMRSALPKVLHPILGRPMILWPILAAQGAGAGRIVVIDGPKRPLDGLLPEGVETAVQQEPKGTGDAVKAAAAHIDEDAPVLVLNGDLPLITSEVIAALLEGHAAADAAATIATTELDDPGGYGRVVRAGDGSVERVVETKDPRDATAAELAIREVNTGVYAFQGGDLLRALEHLRAHNAQGELYLPDVLPLLRTNGRGIAAHPVTDPTIALGVNDRRQLAQVAALARTRINDAHMLAGVTLADPASTYIEADVTIGRDTVIEPTCFLKGTTTVGQGCRIGPLTTLIDATVADNATVLQSHVHGAHVEANATVGPFTFLRPGAHLHETAKAGAFVEIKNSEIGVGTKVPHLSYIGDADIGDRTNIGAGNITANYDGQRKHRTTIGDDVKTSSDTVFVAPVTVGDGAYTGAGSVITDDVPPGALGMARSRQTNIEDYAERRSRK
jgi:bifunctional UDP-N-acetylglucosamine pyrophosphorylase / glucosamine-1-phosphate N-acetyltransferase